MQEAPIENISRHGDQEEIQRTSMETNNLFNKLIGYNYNSKFSEINQLTEDLTKFFDFLLWSEKKCPELSYQLFDMMALQQIQELHLAQCLPTFFKGYILLMGNCKEGGVVAEQMLQYRLPHLFLQVYLGAQKSAEEEEQLVQYIGSYLKCYDRLFRPDWLEKFMITEEYFELLEICFKFFVCPEPLTRTSVFNIVLDILNEKPVQQFILKNKSRAAFYERMAQIMTQSLKNQLITYGNKIQEITNNPKCSPHKLQQIMKQLQDLLSLWQDISKTCSKIHIIFQMPFIKNVLLPLLIGPLTINIQPLFTIKYSMFILKKIIKVISHFYLLDVFVRIVFVQEQVFYWPDRVAKTAITNFDVKAILDQEVEVVEERQKIDFGSGIKKFYSDILRSKDNHFLIAITSLLSQLIPTYKQSNPPLPLVVSQKNNLSTQICLKLLPQLTQSHRLITIQWILHTIITLNNEGPLLPELQEIFVMKFRKIIQEIKVQLKGNADFWDLLVQCFQFDVNRVQGIRFGEREDAKKVEELVRVLFIWDAKNLDNGSLPFYSAIPDTAEDQFRSTFVKFLMLRKANSFLTDIDQKPLVTEYYTKFPSQYSLLPGSVTHLSQISNPNIFHCQIVDQKHVIPALWNVDDNFFVVGHFDKMRNEMKIIMTIKYKFLSCELVSKKDKMYLAIGAEGFDFKKQRISYRSSVSIKGIEGMLPRIVANQIKARQRQMSFITSCIKKTEEMLPKPSLI